jgi:hypothetical protein
VNPVSAVPSDVPATFTTIVSEADSARDSVTDDVDAPTSSRFDDVSDSHTSIFMFVYGAVATVTDNVPADAAVTVNESWSLGPAMTPHVVPSAATGVAVPGVQPWSSARTGRNPAMTDRSSSVFVGFAYSPLDHCVTGAE